MKNLINSLELCSEIEELKDLGLTEEEILGFIDFFYEGWFPTQDNVGLN